MLVPIKYWTRKEISLLNRSYPIHGPEYVAKKLGRTNVAVRHKARKTGVVFGDAEGWMLERHAEQICQIEKGGLRFYVDPECRRIRVKDGTIKKLHVRAKAQFHLYSEYIVGLHAQRLGEQERNRHLICAGEKEIAEYLGITQYRANYLIYRRKSHPIPIFRWANRQHEGKCAAWKEDLDTWKAEEKEFQRRRAMKHGKKTSMGVLRA